jgi:hypothetical protein
LAVQQGFCTGGDVAEKKGAPSPRCSPRRQSAFNRRFHSPSLTSLTAPIRSTSRCRRCRTAAVSMAEVGLLAGRCRLMTLSATSRPVLRSTPLNTWPNEPRAMASPWTSKASVTAAGQSARAGADGADGAFACRRLAVDGLAAARRPATPAHGPVAEDGRGHGPAWWSGPGGRMLLGCGICHGKEKRGTRAFRL